MGIFDYLEEKNAERVRKARWEDAKKISFGALLGLAIGAATGILYAPQSGEKTRKDLADSVQNASEEMIDKANQVALNAKNAYKTKLGSRLTSIGPAVEAGMDAAQKTFEEKKEKVSKAAEEVKEDVKEAGKDIKEGVKETGKEVKGDAEDLGKDLKKAKDELLK